MAIDILKFGMGKRKKYSNTKGRSWKFKRQHAYKNYDGDNKVNRYDCKPLNPRLQDKKKVQEVLDTEYLKSLGYSQDEISDGFAKAEEAYENMSDTEMYDTNEENLRSRRRMSGTKAMIIGEPKINLKDDKYYIKTLDEQRELDDRERERQGKEKLFTKERPKPFYPPLDDKEKKDYKRMMRRAVEQSKIKISDKAKELAKERNKWYMSQGSTFRESDLSAQKEIDEIGYENARRIAVGGIFEQGDDRSKIKKLWDWNVHGIGTAYTKDAVKLQKEKRKK